MTSITPQQAQLIAGSLQSGSKKSGGGFNRSNLVPAAQRRPVPQALPFNQQQGNTIPIMEIIRLLQQQQFRR